MNDDDPVDDLLAKFREIEPPAGVREANREAMRAAAKSPVTRGWLRRSVATPLPAMLATAALLLVSLTLNVVLWRGQRALTDKTEAGEAASPAAASPAAERDSPSTVNLAMSEPEFEYSETQLYLSGVGVVDRRVFYTIKGLP